MKLLRILVALIIVVMLCGIGYVGFFTYADKISTHDKAIIMLPGFFGSCLIDDENVYWDPISGVRESKISVFEKLDCLFLDEEGRSELDLWAPTMKYDIDLVGGAIDMSYDWFYEVKERFSKQYDIMMFQYDWRLDTRKTAKQLDEFIKVNRWKDVVFVCHSMGGFVASTYLTLGQQQRDKVKLMASMGTPYLGVVELLGLLETGYYPIGAPGLVNLVKPILKDVARNMESIYQMMPSKRLLESDYYSKQEDGMISFIRRETENGWEYLEDFDDILEFLYSRDWARYRDIPEKKGQIKRMFKEALKLQEQFFYVDNQGIERHITEKVNSYFFAGATRATSARLDVNLNGKMVRQLTTSEDHDGTVLKHSALIGHQPDNKRYFLCEGFDHMGLVYKEDTGAYAPVDKIYELIENLKY